ncbi:hypothetical protein ACFOZ7_04900 [Natribaculum luteum]|uniref:GINS subunit domain-containing protein n=1 Tax=Natribaculum luteum TaxID=1586232 RepID=A0ABD5NX06_9EURY|nr:hypothetical protein [Natribaculum luteum]
MNLDELRTVQSKERQKDSLQNLRPSFYQEVGEYIADLEDERNRAAERADDPFASPEVGRLTDEIEAARDVVEAIYERRMGKLVKQASLAAAGMPADDDGLTAEEQDLFSDLVDRIQTNKGRVLDVLEGERPDESDAADDSTDDPTGTDSAATAPADDVPPVPPEEPPDDRPTDPGAATGDAEPSSVSAADVMAGDVPTEPEPSADAPPSPPDPATTRTPDDESADSDGTETDGEHTDADDPDRSVDRVTVRITRDVGSILGVDDREYTLESDDVVTLPQANATPLVDRDAAEPLE